MMITPPIPAFFRKTVRFGPPPPTPVLPVELISASYVESQYVELTFNQPVDSSNFVGDNFLLNDMDLTGETFTGTGGVTIVSSTTIRVGLVILEGATESGILLTAQSPTGIYGPGGVQWAGVSNLVLPFS